MESWLYLPTYPLNTDLVRTVYRAERSPLAWLRRLDIPTSDHLHVLAYLRSYSTYEPTYLVTSSCTVRTCKNVQGSKASEEWVEQACEGEFYNPAAPT